jgi:cell wall-associated NlpC family hydrolase
LIKSILKPSTKIHLFPKEDSPLETECMFGEQVNVTEFNKEWGKCETLFDNYVGWIKLSDINSSQQPTHRVITPRSFIYANENVKSNVFHYIPMGSKLKIISANKEWSKTEIYKNKRYVKGFVPTNHIVPIKHIARDWVSIAESLVDTPYRWGGRDTIGIDCSALIQLSLETIGVNFPRNTNMQANYYPGLQMDYEKLNRGVLIFWEGHVGVMINENQILHSNGFFMSTIIEDLSKAEKRISINHGNIKKLINNFQII